MIRLHHLMLAALGCAVLFAGCGDDPEPTAGDATRVQDAALKFARCMREHGVDLPDPKFSGGRVTLGGPGRAIDPDDPAFARAQEACRPLLEAARPKLTPEQQAEMQERSLRFVRCLREHGLDVPDSAVQSDGGLMLKAGSGTGVKLDDPTFERAQKACRSQAPAPAGERQ